MLLVVGASARSVPLPGFTVALVRTLLVEATTKAVKENPLLASTAGALLAFVCIVWIDLMTPKYETLAPQAAREKTANTPVRARRQEDRCVWLLTGTSLSRGRGIFNRPHLRRGRRLSALRCPISSTRAPRTSFSLGGSTPSSRPQAFSIAANPLEVTLSRRYFLFVSVVSAKQLHQETKAVLNQLEEGESLVITRHGRTIGRMEPVVPAQAVPWERIMGEILFMSPLPSTRAPRHSSRVTRPQAKLASLAGLPVVHLFK